MYSTYSRVLDEMCLSSVEAPGEGERNVTRWDIFYWTYSAVFAVLSILIALFVPDGPWIPLAGYIYFVMLFFRPFLKRWF